MNRLDCNITINPTNQRERNDLTALKHAIQTTTNGYFRKELTTLDTANTLHGHVYTIKTTPTMHPYSLYDRNIITPLASLGWLPITFTNTHLYITPVTPANTDNAQYTIAGLDSPPVTIPPIRTIPDIPANSYSKNDTTIAIENALLKTLQTPTLDAIKKLRHLTPTELKTRGPQCVIMIENDVTPTTTNDVHTQHRLPLAETTHRLLARGLAPDSIPSTIKLSVTTLDRREPTQQTVRGHAYEVGGKFGPDGPYAPEPCHKCNNNEGHIYLVVDEERGHLINPKTGESEEKFNPIKQLFCSECANTSTHPTIAEWQENH